MKKLPPESKSVVDFIDMHHFSLSRAAQSKIQRLVIIICDLMMNKIYYIYGLNPDITLKKLFVVSSLIFRGVLKENVVKSSNEVSEYALSISSKYVRNYIKRTYKNSILSECSTFIAGAAEEFIYDLLDIAEKFAINHNSIITCSHLISASQIDHNINAFFKEHNIIMIDDECPLSVPTDTVKKIAKHITEKLADKKISFTLSKNAIELLRRYIETHLSKLRLHADINKETFGTNPDFVINKFI